MPADAHWIAGKGCEQCGQSGFRGRLAIHEVLQVNDEAPADFESSGRTYYPKGGAASRNAHARGSIEEGGTRLTTLDEVLRVQPRDESGELAGNLRSGCRQPWDSATAESRQRRERQPNRHTSVAGRRVLIVEDSPTIMTVIQYFLELEGFTVLTASDGLLGLELALKNSPT